MTPQLAEDILLIHSLLDTYGDNPDAVYDDFVHQTQLGMLGTRRFAHALIYVEFDLACQYEMFKIHQASLE